MINIFKSKLLFIKSNFLVIFMLISVLIVGALITVTSDLVVYKCYANSFWGKDTLIQLNNGEKIYNCHLHGKFNYPPPSKYPMPFEYPFLTMLLFSFPLLLPLSYAQGFMAIMAVFVIAIYYCLKKFGPKKSDRKFALYLIIGAFGTALVRFDLIVALLLLTTVIAASRKKFVLSYVFLALAVCFKFFPFLLAIPLFIFEQKQIKRRGGLTTRLRGMGIFFLVIFLCFSLSALLNLPGTLKPFEYFLKRPIQIESLPAVAFYIFTAFDSPFCLENITGCISLFKQIIKAREIFPQNSISSETIVLVFNLISIIIISMIIYLQFRNKLKFISSFILVLISLLLTSKVFSPQYVIWIIPLMAFSGLESKKTFVIFLVILFLTSLIYPFLYGDSLLLIQNDTWLLFAIILRDILLPIFFYRFFKSQFIFIKESKS